MCFRFSVAYHLTVNSPREISTTHWSVVLAAKGADTGRARAALSVLCKKYWPALYAYLRRKGYPEEQAKDLMQDFFAHFLEDELLRNVSPEKGRFRSFLLVCLQNFLANKWDRARAQKRGGHLMRLSLDALTPYEPATDVTPETAFERQWAHSLLNGVLDCLGAEYAQSGKTPLFEALCPYLSGSPDTATYREVGHGLEMSEGAVKVAVHRMRKRYRELVRQEIAQTLGNEADIDGELRYLISIL
ncbi:MAG: sigma-70 family RNA polymerase sigma factor [Candidatus Hydrogenedentes bacterium]|nr:sigma-70 family RNA polymerase sigma factor [Candidatus Hydrogenedentota bacterium]